MNPGWLGHDRRVHVPLREAAHDPPLGGAVRSGGCITGIAPSASAPSSSPARPGGEGRPEEFWPISLEDVTRSGSTREDGLPTEMKRAPAPPAELQFGCRCNCRLVARAGSFGQPVVCPKCQSKFVLKVAYRHDCSKPITIPSYPGGAGGQSHNGPTKILLTSLWRNRLRPPSPIALPYRILKVCLPAGQ